MRTGSTFASVKLTTTSAFHSQQNSTPPKQVFATRNNARGTVQYGRMRFAAANAMLRRATTTNPRKKYIHTGERDSRNAGPSRIVVDDRFPIHQTRNRTPNTSSAVEPARGILIGSRTGGSLRGFQLSKSCVLACTRSSTANTAVIAPAPIKLPSTPSLELPRSLCPNRTPDTAPGAPPRTRASTAAARTRRGPLAQTDTSGTARDRSGTAAAGTDLPPGSDFRAAAGALPSRPP